MEPPSGSECDPPSELSRLPVPTEEDWRSEEWNIDTPYAYDDFQGKTLHKAAELLQSCSVSYSADFDVMPPPCFQFYMHAYINYLVSGKSAGDSDAASCFLRIVEFRCEAIRGSSELLIARVKQAIGRIREGQAWYDAPRDLYGDFSERAEAALASLERKEKGSALDT